MLNLLSLGKYIVATVEPASVNMGTKQPTKMKSNTGKDTFHIVLKESQWLQSFVLIANNYYSPSGNVHALVVKIPCDCDSIDSFDRPDPLVQSSDLSKSPTLSITANCEYLTDSSTAGKGVGWGVVGSAHTCQSRLLFALQRCTCLRCPRRQCLQSKKMDQQNQYLAAYHSMRAEDSSMALPSLGVYGVLTL